jgi:cell division protease FtsH
MITQFGMSERLGVSCLGRSANRDVLPVPTSGPKEYSEETARLVDEEIKKVLSEAHAKVRNCLASHKQALEEVAKLLLEREVVERPQLQAILKGADGRRGDRLEDFGDQSQAHVGRSQTLGRIIHARRKTARQCRSKDELGGAKTQRRKFQ